MWSKGVIFSITFITISTVTLFMLMHSHVRMDKTVSEILQEVIEYCKFVAKTALKVSKFGKDNIYDDIIHKEIYPALHEWEKIDRQIIQYEKMSEIPEDSKAFLDKSLKSLDNILKYIPNSEAKYNVLSTEKNKVLKSIEVDCTKCFGDVTRVFQDQSIQELENVGIHFEAPSKSILKEPRKTFTDIVEMLSDLRVLFAKLEQLKYVSPAGTISVEQESLDRQIKQKLKKDGPFLRIIVPMLEQVLETLKTNFAAVKSKEANLKKNDEETMQLLAKDVSKTINRIFDLKLPKKANIEL